MALGRALSEIERGWVSGLSDVRKRSPRQVEQIASGVQMYQKLGAAPDASSLPFSSSTWSRNAAARYSFSFFPDRFSVPIFLCCDTMAEYEPGFGGCAGGGAFVVSRGIIGYFFKPRQLRTASRCAHCRRICKRERVGRRHSKARPSRIRDAVTNHVDQMGQRSPVN